jgi:Trk K+ transport system NAD-binding subunit
MIQGGQFNTYLIELKVDHESNVVGKRLVDLELPEGALVVLINRAARVVIPQGRTIIEPDDYLLILAPPTHHDDLLWRFTHTHIAEADPHDDDALPTNPPPG